MKSPAAEWTLGIGYPGLREVGDHFDRLASSRLLRDLEVLSRMGSDHPRLRARVG